MDRLIPLGIAIGAVGALTTTFVAQRATCLWLTSQLRSCRTPTKPS
jgi:hypothetical protein